MEQDESLVDVFLISPRKTLRKQVTSLLTHASDLHLVGQVSTASQATFLPELLVKAVLLVDADDNPYSLSRLFEWLSTQSTSGSQALLLVSTQEQSQTWRKRTTRISGVVLHAGGFDSLLEAIRSVARGEQWYGSEAIPRVLPIRASEPDQTSGWSEPEKALLRDVITGLSDLQIAARLKVPVSNVKARRRQLYQSIGICTRNQLMVAIEEDQALLWLKELRDRDGN